MTDSSGASRNTTALCLNCEEDLGGLRADAKFCSNRCRQAAYRKVREAPEAIAKLLRLEL